MEATIKTLATKDDVSNLRKEMEDNKADIMKWMFIFWVGLVGATLAILLLFVKNRSFNIE